MSAAPSREDDGAEILRLVHAVGLSGFKSSACGGRTATTPAATQSDPVLAIIRAAGLPGFKPTADEGQIVETSGHPANVQATAPAAQPSTAARMTRQSYAVLDVAPGGEAALAQLESAMGATFAADRNGKPYWFGSMSADGGTSRAFTFTASQLQSFAVLLGELGSSSLRLSVRPIERSRYELTGPGASEVAADRGAPQLPLGLPKACRAALGR